MNQAGRRLTRGNTIEAINRLASCGEAFLFLISYKGEGNLVLSPEEAREVGLFMDIPGFKNHN